MKKKYKTTKFLKPGTEGYRVNQEVIQKEIENLKKQDAKQGTHGLFAQDDKELKDVILGLAGEDEEKRRAYERLVKSKNFQRLETQYFTQKQLIASGSTTEDQAKQKMLEDIITTVEKMGPKNIAKGDAPNLNNIMADVALALKGQNQILNSIATRAKDGKMELILTASTGSKSSKPAPGEINQ